MMEATDFLQRRESKPAHLGDHFKANRLQWNFLEAKSAIAARRTWARWQVLLRGVARLIEETAARPAPCFSDHDEGLPPQRFSARVRHIHSPFL